MHGSSHNISFSLCQWLILMYRSLYRDKVMLSASDCSKHMGQDVKRSTTQKNLKLAKF